MPFSKDWCKTELKNMDYEVIHRPVTEEYLLYDAVKSGDMDAVVKNCASKTFKAADGVGVLSSDPLRNLKYHFVVTAALITRYCIEGGLEEEQAYRLSDFYILKMDACKSLEEVSELYDIMAKDFTGKMILLQKKPIISKPVMDCVDYIYSHIKERITVQDLADYTGLSASYLSRIFKSNLGVSISDYVREKKIEKATHLLKYSDQSFADIAQYLSFSSQSHFIQTFENFTGLTPKKYRELHYKHMW